VTRQRVHLRTPALAYLVRLLTLVLGLALIWYGLMVILLAVKLAPHTVNSISAYRTLYHDVADLTSSDFTTRVRLIAGFGGLLALLMLLYLAAQELPRPYLARGAVILDDQPHGQTAMKPRAVERLAEIAAQGNSAVTSVAGRLGNEELNVSIATSRASLAADTLTDVRLRVRSSLTTHDLSVLPVNVTLTGYDRKTKRELA
jgi:hypothetical protein